MSDAPRKKAGLWEMATAAGEEAARIRSTQAAIAKAFPDQKPSIEQIRKAEVFEDMEKLLLCVYQARDQVRAIIAPIAKAMENTEQIERDRLKAEEAPQEQNEHQED